jgi:peptide/nickel transport system ATP-binding protein
MISASSPRSRTASSLWKAAASWSKGPAKEILTQPKHSYTRMLIGAVPSLKPRDRPEPTGPVALEAIELAKTYGQRRLFSKGRIVRAAHAVDLQVRRGETLGIVGESGSGKTTVARCVARLIEPSAGRSCSADADIAKLRERQLRPYRRRIQVVFQDPYRSLNPRRTVGASIVEGPVNYGLSPPTR